jgi:hypothetical protein
VVTGKEMIASSKFQNNLLQTQLYFSFLLFIILLARTSVEVPGTLQKILEFWTPLHVVYKKCPCLPRQAGISCFTSSFPSQYQSEASSLLHSQSIPLSLSLSSLK